MKSMLVNIPIGTEGCVHVAVKVSISCCLEADKY